MCAHCTCMAGIGEACTHIAALLFAAEANTQVKSQFSCTSLPCSGLPPSFRKVPYAEISQIDFTTPMQKCKLSLDIPPASQEIVDKYVPRKKILLFLSLPMKTKGSFTWTCPNRKDLQCY